MSLLSVLGGLVSIPIHKSIVVGEFHSEIKNKDQHSPSIETGISLEDLEKIASDHRVLNFIGDLRSINHRLYEDVIIGTIGSIIGSSGIETILEFHTYNRSLHLFLAKYNSEIESQWLLLDKCDDLLDQTESKFMITKTNDKIPGFVFSQEQHKLLNNTKSQIINAIKEIDYFIVLTQYITDSIGDTIKSYTSIQVKTNSFHLRRLLNTLQNRVKDLDFLSESFITRSRTLVTRIDLTDKMISFEIQQQEHYFREISKSWKRSYTYEIPQSKIEINASSIIIPSSRIIYSLYLPLGENSIIQLVDNFGSRPEVSILDSDLYYFVKVSYKDLIFNFFSRGLVNIESKLERERVAKLVEESQLKIKAIPKLIKQLLSTYQWSLIDVIGNVESIPIHKTIVLESLGTLSDLMTAQKEEKEQENILNGLANDPIVLKYIGHPRSIDARKNSKVIIGTEGSLINSDQIELLLSYHSFNRSLHLFLREYNKAVETAWTTLSKSEELVTTFEEFMSSGEQTKKHKDLFSGNIRMDLTTTKLTVIKSIRNLNNFNVLTQFIEDSINFSIEKYTEMLEQGKVRDNPLENRKVLRILKNRTKQLLVISESFSAKSESLLTRLDIYDSEIAYETQQKIERTGFLIGLFGTILAILAIIVDFKP